MTFWDDITKAFEPEQQKLRQAHARGERLPSRSAPHWVLDTQTEDTGLYSLPLAAETDGSGVQHLPLTVLVWLFFIAGLLSLGVVLASAGGPSVTPAVVPMVGFFIASGLFWMYGRDLTTREYFAPETASLHVRPGDSLLLIVRRRPGCDGNVNASLVLRERWYLDGNDNARWEAEGIQTLPIRFVVASGGLLSAKIAIPKNLPASYDAGKYKLEWSVMIEDVAWWGFPRSTYYVLWIAP